jgi:GNAT superfamily N-acetyltransferase
LPGVIDTPWAIRRATGGDGSFLADMLVEAVNWSPEWKPRTRRRILADAKTARYVAGWPRATDLGVIAEATATPAGPATPEGPAELAGAAWLRFLPASEPGYGFVAEDVPELTIGVAASWRRRGLGRALLRAIADDARTRGIGRISLSVERKNHAQRLYLSEGYRIVDASDKDADTMVKDL